MTAGVAPFLALFVVLTLAYLALIVRAHVVGAWVESLPAQVFRRVVAAFGVGAATLLLGVVVSVWAPVPALVLAAVNSVPVMAILRTVPAAYRLWF